MPPVVGDGHVDGGRGLGRRGGGERGGGLCTIDAGARGAAELDAAWPR